jgi:hypothetical protein
MNLREAGFRFCISPDRKQGQWLHPAVKAHMHADWTDVTDWPSEQLVEFLMQPQQQDLFNAVPASSP